MDKLPNFRTTFTVPPCSRKITYSRSAMWLGSCFTENIGARLASLRFPMLSNPFGIIYNPMSLATVVETIMHGKTYAATDLCEYQGSWFSWQHHHSRFAADTAVGCLNNINSTLSEAIDFLPNTDFLCITFGTAFVYHEISSGQLVANCHKLPARYFTKSLLTTETIVARYCLLIRELLAQFPSMTIIFTLSPVRHWADGAIGNQHSKAILLAAIHQICQSFGNNCYYFPAYELLLDDLRDYRFYANDMLHPNDLAQDYIFEHFLSACVASNQAIWMKEIQQINAVLQHRPINPNSEQHQSLMAQTLERLARWEQATKD